MKMAAAVLVVIVIAVLVYFIVFAGIVPKYTLKQTEEIYEDILDGYRDDRSNVNAHKQVASSLIENFSLEFSTLSYADEEYFRTGIYSLEAKRNDIKAFVRYEFDSYDGESRTWELETDSDFLKELDGIVKTYDLASFNGKNVFVSGLDAMYGDRIDILYQSGETIYASDNQDGFVPYEALREIHELFFRHKA
ncbi:MAG: hypothetical protein J6E38_08070 [Clostridia bacterium]|nr:hypothetical protein [Clostridia bacterium]